MRFSRYDAAKILNAVGIRDRDGKEIRADSGETAAFLRELTFVVSKTYDRKYPEHKARKFIPVNSSIPAGAESFVWRSYDYAGAAKIISHFADDLPMVAVIAGEVAQGIKSLGDAYQYGLQDMRAAAMSGTPLSDKLGYAVRRIMENAVEKIAAVGNSTAGLPGFINNPNIPLLSAPGDITGNWPAATPKQMYDDLHAMTNHMVTSTKEVFVPDTLILPTSRFSLAATTAMSDTDSATVLQRFLQNSPYIRNVDQWAYLDTADAAGTGPRAIVYNRSPENVELIIPQEFEQLPPQLRNLAAVINCHMRIGGVVWYYFLAGLYVDGI
jgi:hypothetical protein